jgi:polar amino acid transport system substrate-binding protein
MTLHPGWLRLLGGLLIWFQLCGWASADTLDDIRARGTLTWGTDLEGGAPFVMADPADPNRATGFETEIGHLLARELGVKGRLVHNAWDSLIPALQRGNFDMVFSGLEVTPDRESKILFSRPYYIYAQQIVTRDGDEHLGTLKGLKNKRVGTLGGSVAERLLNAQGDIQVMRYTSSVQPYEDLLLGRSDAVVQDLPIALIYGKRPGLTFAGTPFKEGYYAIGFRSSDPRLKAAVDQALDRLFEKGEIARILTRYGIWSESQKALTNWKPTPIVTKPAPKPFIENLKAATPLLMSGTWMTIKVSVLAMMLAIILGSGLAIVRVYGPPALSFLAACYVELFRGTPLLVQLFLIYYGLPNLGIQLEAFVAAVIGLGLNYAAYEAENYRAGLLAVPRGQAEAALSLGMSRWQALVYVQLPQSMRIVIPPVTNDFIALFKDSSVVSIITLVELTKAYGMMASATYDYIGFGLVTAAIYFCLSYPTSLLARTLEKRLRPH